MYTIQPAKTLFELAFSPKKLCGMFPAQVLHKVLTLWRMEQGTNYRAVLFYYDSEFGHYEATWWERFRFFVTVGDDIVEDSFELSSLCEHDIDESVLKPARHEGDSWKTPGQDTGLRWWYRRFYTETRAGKLMVLRTDSPRIFHYAPPEHREAANAKHLATIAKASTLVAAAACVAVAAWVLRLIAR